MGPQLSKNGTNEGFLSKKTFASSFPPNSKVIRASIRIEVATPEGLEPAAYWFEANRSIHLRYGVSLSIFSRRLWQLAPALYLMIWFVPKRSIHLSYARRFSLYWVCSRLYFATALLSLRV